jgi:tetratricopeptide (TPR) repeat protein
MTAQAIALAQASVSSLPGEVLPMAWLGHAYARGGHKGEALDFLQKLGALSKEQYVSPYNVAVLYIGLGDKDRAIEWLERAVQERSGLLVYVNVEPVFDPLRSDPRFQSLLRHMNFPK